MKDEKVRTVSNCPLKEIFPDVKQRHYHARKKLEETRFEGAIIIRVEPHDRTELRKIFLTLKVPPGLNIAYLNGTISKKLAMPAESALYLFCQKKILLNSASINALYEVMKEEDELMYIEYAEIPTF